MGETLPVEQLLSPPKKTSAEPAIFTLPVLLSSAIFLTLIMSAPLIYDGELCRLKLQPIGLSNFLFLCGQLPPFAIFGIAVKGDMGLSKMVIHQKDGIPGMFCGYSGSLGCHFQ